MLTLGVILFLAFVAGVLAEKDFYGSFFDTFFGVAILGVFALLVVSLIFALTSPDVYTGTDLETTVVQKNVIAEFTDWKGEPAVDISHIDGLRFGERLLVEQHVYSNDSILLLPLQFVTTTVVAPNSLLDGLNSLD